ncbi:MAG: RNA methyltransferase [Planctomycetota bacterium]
MPLEPVTSHDNPTLKRLRKLRKSRERRKQGVLIAEGRREVQRAQAAGLRCELLVTCPPLLGPHGLAEPDAESPGAVRWIEVPAGLFETVAYHDKPEGVLGVFAEPSVGLAELTAGRLEHGPPLVLIAVGAEKPGNLGAMVRSAEAAGAAAVLSVDGVVDPYNPNAIRNSTGAVFTTPVVACDTPAALGWARAQGLTLVASLASDDARSNAQACWSADLSGPLAIVVGPEAKGLPDDWAQASDLAVTIPTLGRTVDSLNASVAAAVLLFEARRQREAAPTRAPVPG